MVRLLARVIGIGIDRMTSALPRLGGRGFKPHAGCCPAAYAELFPTRARYTALSIGYNIAVAIFGGFAPFIATWLIRQPTCAGVLRGRGRRDHVRDPDADSRDRVFAAEVEVG
jgi:hypothetical protein